MAARKSTASKSHSGRNRPAQELPRSPNPGTLSPFEHAVDSERMRLMKAHSLLQCIGLALESTGSAEPIGASGPYFPDVVGLASDLVRASINRLDLVLLRSPKPGR